MPTIIYNSQRFIASVGQNIRSALQQHGVSVHNGQSSWFNCKGLGTCGTCAVEVNGEVSPIRSAERYRLQFPPHKLSTGLRLACQCKILGDVSIQKHTGFWGHQRRETGARNS